jgi:hypothetical protein
MATAKKATGKVVTTRSRRAAKAVEEGPRYRLLRESFIDQVLYPAGREVTYFGEPGSALLPLNAEAKARKAAVRDIRNDPDLDDEDKKAARKELSDEWNGVEAVDDFAEGDEAIDDNTGRAPGGKPALPDADRAKLEEMAKVTAEQQADANLEDTNRVTVKLQGHNELDVTEHQGRTPVLNEQGKGTGSPKK